MKGGAKGAQGKEEQGEEEFVFFCYVFFICFRLCFLASFLGGGGWKLFPDRGMEGRKERGKGKEGLAFGRWSHRIGRFFPAALFPLARPQARD
jgi:hypothetical protein